MQHRPAGDEQLELGRRGEQVGDEWCGVRDLLEVVEYDQQVGRSDARSETFVERLFRRLPEPQGLRDTRRDERRVADRRQGHEVDTVLELLKQLCGGL